MATGTLTGQTIANTYKALLKITGTTAGGETLHATTQKVIEDGDGNPFPFSAAQDAILMTGTSRIEFNDAGEYISGNGSILSIVGGNEIDLTATAIDINGAVDMSSTVQVGGALTVGANDLGHDVIFYGDTASSNMTWDTSGDDLILNDATLNIDQDDNVAGIYIDSEATSGIPFQIDSPATTTVNVLTVNNCNALTDGGVAYFHSAAANDNTRNIVDIHNDNALATGATALQITQDAAAHAMKITQNGNDYGLEILGIGNTAIQVLEVSGNALTTGAAGYFYSASDRTADFPLVEIQDDNAADGGYGLKVRVDGNGDLIRGMAQGNNNKFVVKNDGTLEISGAIKFPASQSASSDANSLDDYEEGAWTPQFFDASSGGVQAGVATATGIYVKVGSLVNLTCEINVNSLSGITMGNTVFLRNLPFPTKASTSNMYPPIVVGYATALNISAGVSITGRMNHNGSSFGILSAFDNAGGITELSFTELSDNANMSMSMTYRSTS